MVIPCEPQIRCMRASGTTYVAEEVEAFLSRENKSGSGLCSPRLLFFLQPCTLCVFLSISALAPFLGESSNESARFQWFSSPARVAVFTHFAPAFLIALACACMHAHACSADAL